jgi:glycosyltransferase involved in cell wall biosynthesis
MQVTSSAKELVSVVIPCYNSGATLAKTIASVRSQTWGRIELIVVDDGSSDEHTINILNALSGVRLIRQQNSGLPAARNTGFSSASGDYFLPLDADDWLEPDAIERLLLGLKGDISAQFAYSYIQLEGEARGILEKSYNFFEQLFVNQIPYCILIPRGIWESVGGYDDSMRHGYEDWELNIRLGVSGYFGHVVRYPLLHYRVASSGMLISRSNQIHCLLWLEIQKKHTNIFYFLRLIKLWWIWRAKKSRHPLLLYFVWFYFCNLLPISLSSKFFKWFRKNAHLRRINIGN